MEDIWRWKVPIPDFPFRLDHYSLVTTVGSCFADEIGAKLEQAAFDIFKNPHGILFDPFSAARVIKHGLNPKAYNPRITQSNGLFHSLDHHGSFSDSDESVLRERITHTTQKLHERLKTTRCLLLTFGTAMSWVWNEDGQTAANCHKIPQSSFTQTLFKASEIVEIWKPLICALREENSQLHIVISVSPVRYFKGSPEVNTRSKAQLILAANELSEEFDFVHYFPAYEILIDELRDYRFYKDDLRHPSDLAVEYIWQAFQESCMQPELIALNQKLIKLDRRNSHRPKAKPELKISEVHKEVQASKKAIIQKFYSAQNRA